jgi:hypothetical protein
LQRNFELAETFTNDAKAAGSLVSVAMSSRVLALGDSVSVSDVKVGEGCVSLLKLVPDNFPISKVLYLDAVE